jgi:hypothetical protein
MTKMSPGPSTRRIGQKPHRNPSANAAESLSAAELRFFYTDSFLGQRDRSELAADRLIHVFGTFAGVVGSAMLAGIAAGIAERPIFLASLIYSPLPSYDARLLGSLQPSLQRTPPSAAAPI